jgi:fructokinase
LTLKVLCYGEVVTDLIQQRRGIFKCKVGGAPLNVAVGLSRLGENAIYMGSVGDDWFGKNTLAYLKENKIKHRVSLSPDFPTRIAVVSHDADNERAFSFSAGPAAENSIRPGKLAEIGGEKFEVIYFGSFSFAHGNSLPAFRDFIQSARSNGARTVFDPNIRLGVFASDSEARRICLELIELSDVVRLNSEELAFLCGERRASGREVLKKRALYLSDAGSRSVFVTDGAKGSHAYAAGDFCSSGPFRVKVADSTGCGDAFTASMISGLFGKGHESGQDLPGLLRRANAAGAIAATKFGGADSMPSGKELRKMLKSMSGGR